MLQRLGQSCACSHATEVLGIEDLEVAANDGAPDGLRLSWSHSSWIKADEGELQAVFAWRPDAQVGEGEETSVHIMLIFAEEW